VPDERKAAEPARTRILRRILGELRRFLVAGAALAAVCTLAGFVARTWWCFELTCHFRAQYFVVLVAAALGQAATKQWRSAVLFGAFGIVNLALIVPLYVPPETPPPRAERRVRVLLVNVHTANRRSKAVLALVERTRPDVVVLAEVNDAWLATLSELRRTFPHSVEQPRNDNFGIALFSRHPLRGARVVHLGRAGVPSIFARVGVPGAGFGALATHPLPPSSADYARHRNAQLDAVAAFAARHDAPLLVLGDLNVTPWSPYFSDLLKTAGLRDSARGHGIQPTWPAGAFWLWVPIDHCFHSPETRVVDRRVGPDIGSDHYPLIVELAVPAGAPEPKGELAGNSDT
jgi:endonuclease/exonuclease/phosphatase (EEP) superfamily protein YafD